MQSVLLSLNYFSKLYTFKSSCLLFGNNPCCTSMKLSLNMQSRVKLAKMLMEPFTFLRLSFFLQKVHFLQQIFIPHLPTLIRPDLKRSFKCAHKVHLSSNYSFLHTVLLRARVFFFFFANAAWWPTMSVA